MPFTRPYRVGVVSELNLHAMRMGPGKHLKGLKLMNGLVKPEEFDYFHEVSAIVDSYPSYESHRACS